MAREHDHNEEVVRRFYDALTEADADAALAECGDAFELHIPGKSPLSGTIDRDSLGEWLRRAGEVGGGTYRAEVLDVLTSERHVAAYLHHRVERNGETRGYQTIHLWELVDGKLGEGREHARDLHSLETVWE